MRETARRSAPYELRRVSTQRVIVTYKRQTAVTVTPAQDMYSHSMRDRCAHQFTNTRSTQHAHASAHTPPSHTCSIASHRIAWCATHPKTALHQYQHQNARIACTRSNQQDTHHHNTITTPSHTPSHTITHTSAASTTHTTPLYATPLTVVCPCRCSCLHHSTPTPCIDACHSPHTVVSPPLCVLDCICL